LSSKRAVAGALRCENRHGVIDVIFFFSCDAREGFAQGAGGYCPTRE